MRKGVLALCVCLVVINTMMLPLVSAGFFEDIQNFFSSMFFSSPAATDTPLDGGGGALADPDEDDAPLDDPPVAACVDTSDCPYDAVTGEGQWKKCENGNCVADLGREGYTCSRVYLDDGRITSGGFCKSGVCARCGVFPSGSSPNCVECKADGAGNPTWINRDGSCRMGPNTPFNGVCVAGVCKFNECEQDSDCSMVKASSCYVCSDNKCVLDGDDADSIADKAGEACVSGVCDLNGACVPSCSSNSDCSDSQCQECKADAGGIVKTCVPIVPDGNACTTSAGDDGTCSGGMCVPDGGCPTCESNEFCEAGICKEITCENLGMGQECGNGPGLNCCLEGETCIDGFLIDYCIPSSENCELGEKLCGTSPALAVCCNEEDICMSKSVYGTNVYYCGSESCESGQSECGGGFSSPEPAVLCCDDATEECKVSSGLPYCNALVCDKANGETLCSGVGSSSTADIDICCGAGEVCGSQPNGAPRCITPGGSTKASVMGAESFSSELNSLQFQNSRQMKHAIAVIIVVVTLILFKLSFFSKKGKKYKK